MAEPTSTQGSAPSETRRDNRQMKTRRAVRGKPFSSRNPTTIGAIGLVLILAIMWAAFNASSLPLIGGGTVYKAYFTESAGLRSTDDVRIAGVKVGTVQSVSLADHDASKVEVKFIVKNAYFGDQSTLSIALKTLLGAKYMAIDSQGQHEQSSKHAIKEARTTTPFDVYPAFTELTQKVQSINTASLAQAFSVLSNDFSFQGAPQTIKSVLTGLSRLSTTISSRDGEISDLLTAANQVTGVLADRDQDLSKLLSQGDLLLTELNDRRDAIHSLLTNTSVLATQLEGLVADNQKTIGPLLDNLHGVLSVLQANQDSLDRGLALLGPFYRVFTNTLGNGRWFDNYIQNLSGTGLTCLILKVGCTS
jgi:phospholipid/cholesterol/gamma-HCH transport system substrate-binding protein